MNVYVICLLFILTVVVLTLAVMGIDVWLNRDHRTTP